MIMACGLGKQCRIPVLSGKEWTYIAVGMLETGADIP